MSELQAVEPPLRFGAAIPIANDWKFIPAVVGQLLKVCDRVVILRSRKSFSGLRINLVPVPDLEVLKDPRVEIMQKKWESEGDVRNAGMEILSTPSSNPACDYVFIVDADEILTTEALEKLKAEASKGHRAVACFAWTYWKTPQYRIEPPEHICATMVIEIDVRFKHMRVIEGGQHVLGDKLVHHLSYVRSDDEIKEKLSLYAHAHQIHGFWYERSWKGWDKDKTLESLHPINPGSFERAVLNPCGELEAILKEYGVT